jgi:sortase A
VAHIVIPKIGVDKIVVEGVSLADLKRGPGHFPGSPLPGQQGNAAIAGHRTTYGAPFNRLDELDEGDEIRVTTLQGTFRYEVADTEGDGNGWFAVQPEQVEVLDDAGDDRLTLAACHPKYSARERIIVVAKLTVEPLPAPPPDDDAPAPTSIDAGLSGERSSAWPAIWYGLACALVFAATWFLARRWRKWPAYAIGLVPFAVLLFLFFESFDRLLPANY